MFIFIDTVCFGVSLNIEGRILKGGCSIKLTFVIVLKKSRRLYNIVGEIVKFSV